MASCINSFHEHDYLTRNISTLHGLHTAQKLAAPIGLWTAGCASRRALARRL